jgi:hypothetical protein
MVAPLHLTIGERVLRAGSRVPLALLDVDLTLVENAPRTRALFADFCRNHCPELEARAWTMPLAFSVLKNAEALGIPEHLRGAAFDHWRRTFFAPEYLVHDVALEGAVAAVETLIEAGVTVVYLTARPSRLAAATVQSFQNLGFPLGVAQTLLVTKHPESMADQDFKQQALGWLGRLGEPVLVADNEPAHVNAMHAAFPGALAVHVATRHSEPAPPLMPAVVAVPRLCDAVIAD